MIKTNRTLRTPYYQYSPRRLEQNIQEFNKFEENGIDVFYAIKANNYQPLVLRMIEAGYGFDIASKEELLFVNKLGANMAKVSFSAPTKLEADLQEASNLGVRYYAFDSVEEIKKILKNTKSPKLFARMSVRNKEASFNLSENFGMTEAYFVSVLKKAKKYKWPICGLTFHVGSQNVSVSSWRKALKDMARLVRIAQEYGIKITFVNVGGGIPVPYNNGVKPTSYFVNSICKQILRFKRLNNIEYVFIEPGRALSANTMVLFTKVVNIKSFKRPPILVVDLSVFNGLIEPLEHFEYPVFEYKSQDMKNGEIKKKNYQICGISCDGYDIIKRQCLLPADIKVDDILIIPFAGAYSFVYENFHMRKFPEIYTE